MKNLSTKSGLHPRNKHRSAYDFPALVRTSPELEKFVRKNPYGNLSIDFSDPKAVKALNRALLRYHYEVEHWDIPERYLCPPIPSRVDYLHYLADLLSPLYSGKVIKGRKVKVLDIGTGANCIYPILGNREYNWAFVASEVDKQAFDSARKNIITNKNLKNKIDVRFQKSGDFLFRGIVEDGEEFDLTMCNPPFHASVKEAEKATESKWNKLGKTGKKSLNFGGQNRELWYKGGEKAFIRKMIEESRDLSKQVLWFTSLVSKKESLENIKHVLRWVKAKDVKVVEMKHGQKTTRFVAWTFMEEHEQKAWAERRWK
ncbi:MAG: 23S rRNA (adenine(1618)-N(6))-methyltransferase RlmF [Cytophagales bacterium]|nr:23S rRNA (adenine(1618)-N(6))-methyltransferase RlmF [Cytophagales bacterium]